ncbi:DNA-directed RNA polymerase subunit delta [Bacillus sp. HNG]|uniref:DNA-directed RNA polymerase subunit delta n=1 Tax=Bacillus sp. HNG TaxID=2293325 RepID=UPI000E2EEB39|nr:DNA-directed RNA polymerase subunit delta [Bacillus sp. HNG]RFB17251.1 DNA-directed RNA polymerase subunit delta [Bacillus sp. HNG]
MSLDQYSPEQIKEMSMLEVAYEIFLGRKDAIAFNELVDEVAKVLELSEEELRARISQFYTDINIDGRFITLGDNRWGLRTWYPYEQIDEEVTHTEKPKKKKKGKKKKDEDDDLIDFDDLDEDDLDFDEDYDEEDEDLVDIDDEEEEEEEDFDDIDDEEDEDFDDEEELLDDEEYELDEEDEELEEEDED